MQPREIAEAFSGHRFTEAYPHLCDDVRWNLPGDDPAVDAIGRYVPHEGPTSVVSSADVYEFDEDGRVATITSYAVEIDGA